MKKVIGIIGCGNMGGALLRGFSQTLDHSLWTILAYDTDSGKLEAFSKSGIDARENACALAKEADILILAVKPGQMEELTREITPALAKNKIVISIAAGISLEWLKKHIDNKGLVARCMPTTTAMSKHGIFALCLDPLISRDAANELIEIFEKIGVCLLLPENRFSAFSAFIGAGPAYVFGFMQGLAQAGLTLGFTQEQNRKMLIELFTGCAALAKMQPGNFAQLRDNVCSPGGLTIAGINVLDRAGLSGLIVEAVTAALKRARSMET